MNKGKEHQTSQNTNRSPCFTMNEGIMSKKSEQERDVGLEKAILQGT